MKENMTRIEYENHAFSQGFNVPKVIDDLFDRIEKLEDLSNRSVVCIDCHKQFIQRDSTHSRCTPCFKKFTNFMH